MTRSAQASAGFHRGIVRRCVRTVCAGTLLIAATLPALADVSGTYRLDQDNRLHIDYRDENHIRVEMNDGNLLLVSGDKAWLVMQQGGQRMAVDLDQMGALMGMTGANQAVQLPDANTVKMKATGETESVAGYEGEWYEIRDGERVYRALLTDHPDVVALTEAFASVASRMSRMLDPRQAAQFHQLMDKARQEGPGGVLRQADQLVLTEVDSGPVADQQFELPSGVSVLSMPTGMMPGR